MILLSWVSMTPFFIPYYLSKLAVFLRIKNKKIIKNSECCQRTKNVWHVAFYRFNLLTLLISSSACCGRGRYCKIVPYSEEP